MPPADMLMEIALLGLFSGFVGEAEAIFRAMERLYPRSALPWIGQGLVSLRGGDPQRAVGSLRHALRVEPESDLARSFLVLCLEIAGRGEEARALGAAMRSFGRDRGAMDLIDRILHRPLPEAPLPREVGAARWKEG
ncbi:MAG: hypothetical protein PHO89_04780 [Methylacidiphilaceae bacterium]|nr:hypothetical protein [Candidatus Methylacidiphilaceae bacterium]